MERVTLFNMPFIADRDHGAVLREVCAWPLPPGSPEELPILCTPNVDQLVKLDQPRNHALFERIRKARYVLPDGQPIVWVSRLKGGRSRLPARITGSDLFPALWAELRASDRRMHMVLPSEEVAARLREEKPDLRWTVPPFYSITDAAAEQKVIDTIRADLGQDPIDLLFLGLGFPKQERLALALIDRFRSEGRRPPLMLLLGASFEFHAGLKKRAPRVFRMVGLEFFHRFLTEPGRMFRRYFIDDLAFFGMAWREIRRR